MNSIIRDVASVREKDSMCDGVSVRATSIIHHVANVKRG